MDAGAQMRQRQARAHRQAHPGQELMQPVQDGGGLRQVAEAVTGNRDDEVGLGVLQIAQRSTSRN
ncbi:hypothetical protein UT5_06780 [Ferrigenium sp. UT5]